MSEEQRLRIKCNQYAKRLIALGEEDIVWEADPKLQSAALNINECNLEVGQKYKLFFNPKNVNNKIIEVRAIVDDVVCVYTENSQYRIDDMVLLQKYIDEGFLTTAST